ncbi:predicted protein [Chaetomium globosum CBS 148.51]|uniref:Uncharacterized protein n=1 Tax=Chaetomium globosum (strain ATCC 6205 / CBS 148.51 / DSM 1962 / NBRC 6347 / NRRL 1970) TaxID=306901 RepID=Q2H7M7_CHAGB|nr:uncharacterized protein CHGG_05338 [Chaetomium globosum CBS 148.51]EAQ88719.1 predicted protein [Chaetomium globosum CBS 148.51]
MRPSPRACALASLPAWECDAVHADAHAAAHVR